MTGVQTCALPISGLTPSVIFDIASRALNFHAYQVSQDHQFAELVARKAQARCEALEKQVGSIVQEATSEINGRVSHFSRSGSGSSLTFVPTSAQGAPAR